MLQYDIASANKQLINGKSHSKGACSMPKYQDAIVSLLSNVMHVSKNSIQRALFHVKNISMHVLLSFALCQVHSIFVVDKLLFFMPARVFFLCIILNS